MTANIEHDRTACLSALELATIIVAERRRSLDEAPGPRAHAATCGRCAQQLAALRAREEALLADLPIPELARATLEAVDRQHRTGPWLRPQVWLPILVPIAASVAVLVLGGRSAPEPAERLKGGPSISVIVKRGEQIFEGKHRAVLEAGDRLRFRYTTADARHLALYSVESARKATPFCPEVDPAEARPAAAAALLPCAVELDEARGLEDLVAIFCPAPFRAEDLVPPLSRHVPGAPLDEKALPVGCRASVFTLDKP